MSILLPLEVTEGKLLRAPETKKAVDAFIELLLTTPCQSCVADPQFGFVFNNLKFEIFNENEGVIYHSGDKEGFGADLYNKKVSGTSRSLNTFATELKTAIEQYEKRIAEVAVTMTYFKGQRKVQIHVEGVLVEDNTPYQYTSSINLWN